VALHAKFDVGGSMLDFPGDPLGAYDEIINCRCTALFNIHTAPKFRCDGVLVAATQPGATQCVMPMPKADTSMLGQAVKQAIYQAFSQWKISPAYGGAKIHKVLQETRAAVKANQYFIDDIDDQQLLAVIDEATAGNYKKTFGETYWEWLQSPAGKKAVGTPPKAVTHVIAPIKDVIPPTPPPAAVDPLAKLANAYNSGTLQDVVPPVPLGDLGDISQFDFFAKQDVVDRWVALGKGKKVTPAWGGAKIWKLLEELKHDSDIAYDHVGLINFAPNELQLLRILDEMGGFKGKPKTYESELMKWLQSPAGKKNGPLFLPDSLKITKPVVTPVIKPTTAGQVLASDEVSAAFAASDNKISINVMFVDLPKYKPGDVIAYVKTANGDTLQAKKLLDGSIAVYVRKDSLGGTTWTYDKTFDDWVKIVGEYNIKSSDAWSQIFPPKPILATKIPHKAPGDVVTPEEIWNSKYLWNFDDVIATTSGKDYDVRLVSLGNGDIQVQNFYKFSPEQGWTSGGTLTTTDSAKDAIDIISSHTWKLGGDAIDTKKVHPLYTSKKIGDVVEPKDIWSASAGAPNGSVMAYAYNSPAGEELKLVWDPQFGMRVYSRHGGTTSWTFEQTYSTLQDLHYSTQKYKWHIPNADGSLPDAVKVAVPGKSVPGAIPQSKISGYAVHAEVPFYEIISQAPKFDEYEIIANGISKNSSVEYRLYKLPDGKIAYEYKWPNAEWKIIDVLDNNQPLTVQMSATGSPADISTWYTSADKASSSSIQAKFAVEASKKKFAPVTPVKKAVKKAAKKAPATPPAPLVPKKSIPQGTSVFSGQAPGDLVDKKTLLTLNGDDTIPDGFIVATWQSKSSWKPQEFRLFVVDGKLIQQKKTSAGTWTGTTVIHNEWQMHGSSYNKWVLSNDMVPPQTIKAAKTAIAKSQGTYVAPPKKPKKTTASKFVEGISYKPSASDSEDITKIAEDDRAHIFSAFKGVSEGQLLSHSDEAIFSNAWAWAVQLAKDEPGRYGHLTVMQVIRSVDEQLAKKLGKTNIFLFEKKMKAFMSSAAGRKFIEDEAYKLHKTVKEVFQVDLDTPPNVVLVAGQKVQGVPGPGPFDASVPASRFRTTYNQDMLAMQHRILAATRPWSQKEQQALRNWTSGAYYSWNGYLRGVSGYDKASADLRAKILYGQAGMRPVDEDILMMRGAGWDQLPPGFRDPTSAEKLIGKTFEDKGFFATSTSGDFGGFGGNIRFEVEVPKGTMAAYVNHISHNKGEHELLLAAGLRYHVISVKPNGYGGITMRVRVVS
jgi:hypothetical protein